MNGLLLNKDSGIWGINLKNHIKNTFFGNKEQNQLRIFAKR